VLPGHRFDHEQIQRLVSHLEEARAACTMRAMDRVSRRIELAIYEGMFLLDAGLAATEFEQAESLVTELLERYGGKILIGGRWDDRKLAYSIRHHKRGTYYLVYFEAEGTAVTDIRRDVELIDGILRCLCLRVPDDVPVPEVIEVPKAPYHEEDRDRRGSRGSDRRGFKKYGGTGRCRFTRWKMKYVDWKETQTLSRLCTSQGKMFSRKRSGNSARHQRQFKRAVKYARYMALLPYVAR